MCSAEPVYVTLLIVQQMSVMRLGELSLVTTGVTLTNFALLLLLYAFP